VYDASICGIDIRVCDIGIREIMGDTDTCFDTDIRYVLQISINNFINFKDVLELFILIFIL